MFGVDWSDPQTLWLNLTNLALGVVTLAAVLVAATAVAREVVVRRRHAHDAATLDEEVKALFGAGSPHIMPVPGLGLTMADGGVPLKPTEAPKPEAEPRK